MNYYAKALEICSKEQDWKSIVIEIAKKHPKAVFDAASVDNWEYQAWCLVKEGRKLDAIRLCRSETGKSLRDAKDFVEGMQ